MFVAKRVRCAIGIVCNRRLLSTSSTTDFGFKEVNSNEKEHLVKEVFSKVAQKYDIMNDLMSLGIHRFWKDDFVHMMGLKALKSSPSSGNVPRHLDVAGGTGDIAFRSAELLSQAFPSHFEQNVFNKSSQDLPQSERPVVVCDINPNMLAVGQDRAPSVIGRKRVNMVGFVEGNAEKLPFPDNSFDFYTIAFGLRNVTNKDKALEEAYRVLRPGGKIMILEFSHLESALLQKAYDEYSFRVIPPLGQLVAGDAASYQYLVESIRKFPKQTDLCAMMHTSGFKCVDYRNMTFGIVAVHSGFKL